MMTTCELIAPQQRQVQQQFGGLVTSGESLAIVPDIQSYTSIISGDLHPPCSNSSSSSSNKRTRASATDCLGIEEELELLSQESQQFGSFSFPVAKRHCSNYSISSSPNHFQSIGSPDSIEEFALEVKDDYIFTDSKDVAGIFTCGENSPVNTVTTATSSSSSSSTSTDFTSAQTSAGCHRQGGFGLQNFVPADVLDSGMHRPSQSVLSHPLAQRHADKYELVITEQPEEYYRARYNSEGVRAPLKGMTENYPTVQVYGPEFRYGKIDVKLVHEDGSPHTSCSLDTSEGRKNAVSKKIGPFNHMIAEFEDLRIRRVKKEGRKKSSTIEKTTPKDGRSDKVASLLFTATLDTEQGEIVQSIQSRPISLTTAPEPAELDWLEPNRGHFAGQEPLVIKGSKMTSPKVTFRITLPNGRRQELHGSVDKERSHQNVLLVKTPSLTQLSYQFPHQSIRAEVVVVTGRNQMSSNPLQFDFIPNHICRECMQETPPTRPLVPIGGYPPSQLPPPTYPTPPAPTPAAAAATASASTPPTTPGGPLPPQPSPSPSSQIQSPSTTTTSAQVHFVPPPLQPAPPTYPAHTTDALSSPTCHPVAATAQDTPTQQGKSGDDIMIIMQDLMGQETGVAMKTIDHATYWGQVEAGGHHIVQVSSPYIPVTSPSAASDQQPCYSPVTPVQSPPDNAPWNYIEHMLTSLRRTDQLNTQDYRFLSEECKKHNPRLLQAFNTSHNNENVFLQLLACPVKPDPATAAYQTTPQ